jgi:hypothetical protein
MNRQNHHLAQYGDLTWDDLRPTHADRETTMAKKLFPLKCSACGEAWMGSADSIGNPCIDNPLAAGAPTVFQCDPEELERDIDWDAEGGF